MRTTAERYHDISCGHRVYGHESKCAHLHGHNYRITFQVEGEVVAVDQIGRVMDFSVIKSRLCYWLENNWDHKFLIWEKDPAASWLQDGDKQGVVIVPFNPTAENMAEHLLNVIGPQQLVGTDVKVIRVTVEETRKCSATVTL